MTSCCFFMASSSLGYLALILSISGFSTRILVEDIKVFQVAGNTTSFTIIVIKSKTTPILSPQFDNQSNRLMVNHLLIQRRIGQPK